MKSIVHYFWINSDWAYLGADRLERLAMRHGARIDHRPVDLPLVYRRTGGVLLGERSPQRQAYRIVELKRWCKHLGLHVNAKPRHMCPNGDLASCMVIAAAEAGLPVAALYKAILKAQWCDEQDISDPATLTGIAERLGCGGHDLLARANAPQIIATYSRHTREAITAGVFGSPSYLYGGELFWGQDRLDFLEEALAAD